MKITRSMIEQDAQYLLESVRATDYEIPSSGDIFKVIFKVYVFVVLLQIIGVLFDWLIYGTDGEYYSYSDIAILSTVSLVVVFGVLCMMLYQNVNLALCIPEDVRRQSLICRIVSEKLRTYFIAVILLNTIVAVILLYCGHRHVSYLGASWFVTFIIGGISFSYSMSRYFTPQVMSVFSKINDVIAPTVAENK
ncbi:hypothetical protein DPS92_23440 [Salmonella enterica subsp. enterica serovar Richmond]|uniref:hypothetical protein n=1 Tax=Salmonella enterica TaxID=28901 RepID=UPI000E03729A|nr:hypothetical protein [Salmonella enterica subsp. enterica serovar Richmond]EAA2047578.1 hypothetical protein [Salmonella enterica subsp. enterica serovar Chester]EAB8017813.1 hypothetical protein [Salmonella enterica subsp. enterica serovar Newport]EAC1168360.1 hypothetical protein [Salmonella enterica subsp. enterica serovar Typhimurium]EAP0132389.1 hypothetical protein [Salmonella enterica]EBH3089216.1 hypothetical protein [Salmonella enterica subsp. enterica serovar Poona]ECB7316519.1 h